MVVVRPVLSINSQPSQELVVMFFCLGIDFAKCRAQACCLPPYDAANQTQKRTSI